MSKTKENTHNIIKERLETETIYLVDYNRIKDAEKMINLLYVDDNSRLAVSKKDKAKDEFHQWVVTKEELIHKLHNIITLKDVYISLNSVKGVRRRTCDLYSLNAFVVDLDYYKCPELEGKTAEYVINFLRGKGLFKDLEPSFFSSSGKGMYIVYLIKNANAKACLKIWKKIMNVMYERFKDYGADIHSLDAAHLFRLSGTENTKTGRLAYFIYNSTKSFEFEKEKEEVRRYTLAELADKLLPPLPYSKEEYKQIKKEKYGTRKKKLEEQKKNKEAEGQNNNRGKNNSTSVVSLHTLHNLNYTRMQDLKTLVEIRQGLCKKNNCINVKGNRELMCFLYRLWACSYYKDFNVALKETFRFNNLFKEPLDDKEVINSTKSAEASSTLLANKIQEYNKLETKEMSLSKYLNNNKCYIYSNKKLVGMLEITKEEMKSLKTIILLSIQEKNNMSKNYRSEYKRKNRRNENGLTSREQAKQEKMSKIEILLNEGKKQTEIVKALDISKSLVSMYIKELKEKQLNNNSIKIA